MSFTAKVGLLALLSLDGTCSKPSIVENNSLDRPPVEECYRETQAKWEYLRREAGKKLEIIKRKVGDKAKDILDDPHEIVKRDDYGHDSHDKVVVRCKYSYTGNKPSNTTYSINNVVWTFTYILRLFIG